MFPEELTGEIRVLVLHLGLLTSLSSLRLGLCQTLAGSHTSELHFSAFQLDKGIDHRFMAILCSTLLPPVPVCFCQAMSAFYDIHVGWRAKLAALLCCVHAITGHSSSSFFDHLACLNILLSVSAKRTKIRLILTIMVASGSNLFSTFSSLPHFDVIFSKWVFGRYYT
jgi:hypothetical protein